MNHLPSDDEIDAFFSNITPEAVMEEPEDTHIKTLNSPADTNNEDAFETFWLSQLGEFKNGRRHFAALHDGKNIYYYAHRPGEADWDYISRIGRDAERIGAQWTFICYPGRGARSTNIDASSPDAMEQLEGKLVPATLWYAGSKHHDHVYGMVVDEDFIVSTNPAGANPKLHDILGVNE